MSGPATVTVAALSEDTMAIVAPEGVVIYGGLSPDCLAVAEGRVLVGPIRETDYPEVFLLEVSDEAGVEVCINPARNGDPEPTVPDGNGPTFLLERAPAWGQASHLQTAIDFCTRYARQKYGDVLEGRDDLKGLDHAIALLEGVRDGLKD